MQAGERAVVVAPREHARRASHVLGHGAVAGLYARGLLDGRFDP
ncbi:MAG: hypothetical protein AB7O32_11075 [Vicinamibacterales bacterium]